MITKILKTLIIVTERAGGPLSIGLLNNVQNYLKVKIVPVTHELKKFTECLIKIQNYKELSQTVQHRFFKEDIYKFAITDFTPQLPEMPDLCFCSIIYEFPNYNDNPKMMYIEIFYIKTELIENLKTDKEKKKDLYQIIDRYIKDDFNAAISDMGILSEYIATEIARKIIKKKPKDFRTAINSLVNKNLSGRVKINYNYIGSLLWPLYYVRNQKSHPYHKIEFNRNTSDLCFANLSEVITFLSINKVRF